MCACPLDLVMDLCVVRYVGAVFEKRKQAYPLSNILRNGECGPNPLSVHACMPCTVVTMFLLLCRFKPSRAACLYSLQMGDILALNRLINEDQDFMGSAPVST
jgi:hypothetical protein